MNFDSPYQLACYLLVGGFNFAFALYLVLTVVFSFKIFDFWTGK